VNLPNNQRKKRRRNAVIILSSLAQVEKSLRNENHGDRKRGGMKGSLRICSNQRRMMKKKKNGERSSYLGKWGKRKRGRARGKTNRRNAKHADGKEKD